MLIAKERKELRIAPTELDLLLRRFMVQTPLTKELVTDNEVLRKALFDVQ